MDNYTVRRVKDRFMLILVYSVLAIALIPLFSILEEIVLKGASSINLDFLTQPIPTVGETGGGIANVLQGTLIVVGLASAMAVPIGLVSGIFLSEYAETKLALAVRFFNDVLTGFPSIVVGIFGYMLIVLFIGFSVIAGALALAIIMIPVVTRTTEEALKLVPATVREAAIALGIPRWKTTVSVVLSSAKKGIVTGILLSLARIAGESAPVLVTMGYWRWWFAGLDKPAANLALDIFIFATSPFENWRTLAWGSSLILVILILGINVVVRVLTKERYE